MTPFHFGDRQRRLYGVYHAPHAATGAPHAATGAPRAVVICQPWGPEYEYAHRAIRQLAAALAAAGVHVLRFDYHATGDSDGACEEGGLGGWSDDVVTAMDELRDLGGTRRVTLVGLRLGGYLAACAARSRPQDVDTLVLWDPVISDDYWSDIAAAAQRYPAMLPLPRPSGGYEVFGHAIGARIAAGFERLDMQAAIGAVTAPIKLLVSGDETAFAQARSALGDAGLAAAVHIPARPSWITDVVSRTWFVPADVLNAVVKQVA